MKCAAKDKVLMPHSNFPEEFKTRFQRKSLTGLINHCTGGHTFLFCCKQSEKQQNKSVENVYKRHLTILFTNARVGREKINF